MSCSLGHFEAFFYGLSTAAFFATSFLVINGVVFTLVFLLIREGLLVLPEDSDSEPKKAACCIRPIRT